MQVNNHEQLLARLSQLFEKHQDSSAKVTIDSAFQQALTETVKSCDFPEKPTETKNVSILLSDLRGFTVMAEKYPPLVVIELLNRYFSKMSEIIDSHGGVIDKFMGDSIMALFGLEATAEAELLRTLSCAIEMQIAMDEINSVSQELGMANLYMGIGINTGDVVTGTLGSDVYREYTVIGDQVNLVSRVEAHSLRGQILLSESTYKLAKDYISIGEVNEVMVKGKSLAVKMYELLAIKKPVALELPRRENRRSPRVEVNLPLNYRRLNGKQVMPEVHEASIIDISYGGFFTLTKQELEPHCEIKVTVSLSLMGSGISEIYARALSCRKVHDRYESHLEFTALDEKARKTIKAFVDSLV
ncbi:PilZ domain-containing protein [Gammaproteobacteria bacterium]|nr:PilZ domain-containing protein [Gammaproteobacteria bacterium]